MRSKLKVFLLSATGVEMKYEMLRVDTTGQSSNIPEPAHDWEGEDLGGGKTPRSWKWKRVYSRRWALSFLLTMKINVLKTLFEGISFFPCLYF